MPDGAKYLLLALAVAVPFASPAQSPAPAASIHQLFVEDQQDQQIDNESLSRAEQEKLRAQYNRREAELKRLMQSGGVRSAEDFFVAGVILTHSLKPENQLLAHLAFTAAAFEGNIEAKHLAATSLDRYLTLSQQTPMFGTTFQIPYQGWRHEVSPDMNDAIRAAFCVPSISQLNRMYEQEKAGKAPAEAGHEYWDISLPGCQTTH
ncbi:MAG: hypothetical protein WBW69_19295 [Candidatus Korobacteraceae bacterium]